ncbi:zinc finger BED domain-containing protein 4-like [Leptopilina heterotoma]|uniref:zinc finger BED domain-containing protein 4-like n=1 Tax=Leptopilina heterotoma TaxID=63436 RepID=UPI001CA93B0C|nr:zinc finger BED domain-containing protein 4-like [Leptopilina heterotoma]
MKRTIAKARNAVKQLRTESCLKALKLFKLPKPVLDVPTRWNSTYDMLSSLVSAKNVCNDLADNKEVLRISDIEWERMETCIKALEPSKIATKKMQSENLVPGDLYGICRECKKNTNKVNSNFAANLLTAFIEREDSLLKNEALLCSMFLDPRYLPFLSIKDCITAKTKLKSLYEKIEFLKKDPNCQNSVDAESSSSNTVTDIQDCDENMEEDFLEEERKKMDEERLKHLNPPKTTIEQLLIDFEKTKSISRKENILLFWETRKSIQPELYELAVIVHAVPMTEVSVERLFSGMKFVFSDFRANLHPDILDDILLLRSNENFQTIKLKQDKKK